MSNIKIEGINFLKETEKLEVQSILEKSYEKIKREINNEFLLKINIKEFGIVKDNPEKKKKYSIMVEVSGPVRFKSSAVEWDLKKALHMAMQKLDYEIEHKFHNLDQHRKVVSK